ncbi:MAG: hypothetical protein ACOZJZ_23250 [Pseudomonadota bacterium]|jgi:hypothetical protein
MKNDALDLLRQREEVLQICYWYQGEGFGERYSAELLAPFLQSDRAAIDYALGELAARGQLHADSDGRYLFTEGGRREAGRLFADGFADFQKQGHGECDAGCCDGDDHSRCGDECALH